MGYYLGLAGMLAGFFGWATYPSWGGPYHPDSGGGGGW